jgi:hypothetical protein
MQTKPLGPGNFPLFSLTFFINRYLHSSRIALFALVVLAVVSVPCPAAAEQGFALIGTWEHTERATREILVDTSTIVFKPNGTFTGKWTIKPDPARRDLAPGVITWRGTYSSTGASSWVATVQAYKSCEMKTGSCYSCPKQQGDGRGGRNACAEAKKYGLPVGVPIKNSAKMQGPDTFVTGAGDTFRRVR